MIKTLEDLKAAYDEACKDHSQTEDDLREALLDLKGYMHRNDVTGATRESAWKTYNAAMIRKGL